MLVQIVFAVLFPQPAYDLTLKDIDAGQVFELVAGEMDPKLRGLIAPFAKGKVERVSVAIRGSLLLIHATRFRSAVNPVQRIAAAADLTGRTWAARVYLLGGVVELEGKLPPPAAPPGEKK